MSEQKCPFCGAEIKVFQNMKKKWVPFCDNHECFRFDGFGTKEEAVAAVSQRNPTVSVEDLRGVVADLKMIPTMSTVNKSVAANEAARTLEQLLAKSEGEMTTTTEHQEEG